jgi:hypothetical protein
LHNHLLIMENKLIFNLFTVSILLLAFSQTLKAQSGTVTISADSKINEFLMLKKDLEKENKLSDGYTIQLYYGELNKANSIIRNYRAAYSTWPASIEYETPNYKVWAGNFATRLEADRALMEIQEEFGGAFILEKKK